MDTPRGWRELSNVQCGEVMVHRVVWWRWVGAAPVCPPASLHKGASVVHPHAQCVCFLVWKRRCADVRAGTQAPPLRVLLESIARGCPPLHISFGQIARRRLVSFLLKIVMKFMAKNFALIKNILIFGESKEVFSAA